MSAGVAGSGESEVDRFRWGWGKGHQRPNHVVVRGNAWAAATHWWGRALHVAGAGDFTAIGGRVDEQVLNEEEEDRGPLDIEGNSTEFIIFFGQPFNSQPNIIFENDIINQLKT